MPYIETKIICNNCEYDHGATYINSIPDLTIDDILESFYSCTNCSTELCDNCVLKCDKCEYEQYCNDCINNHDHIKDSENE